MLGSGAKAGAALALVLALIPAGAAEAKLNPGDLLVTDYSGDRVVRWNVKNEATKTFVQSNKIGAASELTFTPRGKVILTDEGDSKVFSIDRAGGITTLVGTGLAAPYGAAYSPLFGLLVADYDRGMNDTGQLIRIPKRNKVRVVAKKQFFDDPIGVAAAPDGTPYVIEQDTFKGDCGSNCGGVIRITPRGKQRVVSSGGFFSDPSDGVVGPNRRIYVADQTGRAVAVNPGNGNQALLANDGDIDGNGIALDFHGDVIVTTQTGIARIGPGGTLEEIAPVAGNPTDVMVVPPRCAGRWATVFGTNGNDKIVGGPGPDVINALGGEDVIKGLGGNDRLCGAGGPDRIVGGKGSDKAVGGGGNDVCRAERESSC